MTYGRSADTNGPRSWVRHVPGAGSVHPAHGWTCGWPNGGASSTGASRSGARASLTRGRGDASRAVYAGPLEKEEETHDGRKVHTPSRGRLLETGSGAGRPALRDDGNPSLVTADEPLWASL